METQQSWLLAAAVSFGFSRRNSKREGNRRIFWKEKPRERVNFSHLRTAQRLPTPIRERLQPVLPPAGQAPGQLCHPEPLQARGGTNCPFIPRLRPTFPVNRTTTTWAHRPLPPCPSPPVESSGLTRDSWGLQGLRSQTLLSRVLGTGLGTVLGGPALTLNKKTTHGTSLWPWGKHVAGIQVGDQLVPVCLGPS